MEIKVIDKYGCMFYKHNSIHHWQSTGLSKTIERK